MKDFIKLTVLVYTLKPEMEEVAHKYDEIANEKLFNWERALEHAVATDGDYVEKPFLEDVEFMESDYDIGEKPIRIRRDLIKSYWQNMAGVTELDLIDKDKVSIYVKESVEEIDKLLEI